MKNGKGKGWRRRPDTPTCPIHGCAATTAYMHRGCRCDVCKAATAAARKRTNPKVKVAAYPKQQRRIAWKDNLTRAGRGEPTTSGAGMRCHVHELAASTAYTRYKCRCDDCLEWSRTNAAWRRRGERGAAKRERDRAAYAKLSDEEKATRKERQRASVSQRRHNSARSKAFHELAARHNDEYRQLYEAAWVELEGLDVLGFTIVEEHPRAIFGFPEQEKAS